MKVKVAIILVSFVAFIGLFSENRQKRPINLLKFMNFAELTDAARRNPYRVSRASRKKKESYDQNFDYDTYQQQNAGAEIEGSHGGDGGDDGDDEYHTENIHTGKSGYSEGSGLRSIAQGSADQANSAVANQHLAAKQASYIAQVIYSFFRLQKTIKFYILIFRIISPIWRFKRAQQRWQRCKANRFYWRRLNRKTWMHINS